MLRINHLKFNLILYYNLDDLFLNWTSEFRRNTTGQCYNVVFKDEMNGRDFRE